MKTGDRERIVANPAYGSRIGVASHGPDGLMTTIRRGVPRDIDAGRPMSRHAPLILVMRRQRDYGKGDRKGLAITLVRPHSRASGGEIDAKAFIRLWSRIVHFPIHERVVGARRRPSSEELGTPAPRDQSNLRRGSHADHVA